MRITRADLVVSILLYPVVDVGRGEEDSFLLIRKKVLERVR
jgi:hypothetical protein